MVAANDPVAAYATAQAELTAARQALEQAQQALDVDAVVAARQDIADLELRLPYARVAAARAALDAALAEEQAAHEDLDGANYPAAIMALHEKRAAAYREHVEPVEIETSHVQHAYDLARARVMDCAVAVPKAKEELRQAEGAAHASAPASARGG
jgi:hypothetical protein